MSLRLKFFILVSGSILVPIAVFLISFRLDTDVDSIRSYRSLVSAHHTWKKEYRDIAIDPANPEESLREITWATELRLYEDNGALLYTRTSPSYGTSGDRFFFTELISVGLTTGGTGYLTVTRTPSPFSQNEDRWYVPLTGLIFVTIMVIVIVQATNRSIGNLDRATKRIADGDLDFELPIKGNDKLASLTRSFDSMREHLKEEYARRSRFIMGISHDLKTPLSSISGYATAIGEGYADTPEKLDKYVGIIEDKTKLLESRISMLIDYVKRETSEWKLNLQPVTLLPFLTELANVFESEALIKKRRFSHAVKFGGEIVVPMDEDMLVRAMENLMQNALNYSPEGSEVIFVCAADEKGVRISLTNEGPGILAEDLPHIFEPFVRGSPGRQGAGFGLGLSTVESVISSHGFAIAVESEPGVSTVFTITIPPGKN